MQVIYIYILEVCRTKLFVDCNSLLHANANEHPDLFWGVRGGGGNFGVVASFEYRLHPVGPRMLGGNVLWPMDQARDMLEFWAENAAAAAPYLLNNTFDATVTSVATPRVAGTFEKTITLTYTPPAVVPLVNWVSPQLTFSRPIIVLDE